MLLIVFMAVYIFIEIEVGSTVYIVKNAIIKFTISQLHCLRLKT